MTIDMHCWHIVSSTADGMAERGWDTERCCWCGLERTHHWRQTRDPKHGPYNPISVLTYAAPGEQAPCRKQG